MSNNKVVKSSLTSEDEAKILKEYEEASKNGVSYGDEIRAQKRRDDALSKLRAKS